MDLGTHLTVLAGPTVPLPLPAPLAARLISVASRETDAERSAFSLTFDAGRSGPAELMDSPLLVYPGLATGSRVSVVVTVNAVPQVMVDGFDRALSVRAPLSDEIAVGDEIGVEIPSDEVLVFPAADQ